MKKLNSIKTLSIFEIFILVLGTIAIAYAIGGSVWGVEAAGPDEVDEFATQEDYELGPRGAQTNGYENPATATSSGIPVAASAVNAVREPLKDVAKKTGLEGLLDSFQNP